MKVSANLNEFPSGYTFKENGMVQLVKKTMNMGLYSVLPKNIKITDRNTGQIIDVNDEILPIAVEEIVKFEYLFPKDRVSKTFGDIMMNKKMELEATRGREPGRYLVEYEL